tara:strand:- start:559 stop:1128 length:570 start_codon:yes stop_codon:yes gene_type:complete
VPVPDNFTFSLNDVKDEIETDDTAIVTSLADAFTDSNEFGFDDTYDDSSGTNTQSLREFRNYDHSATDPGGGNGGSSIEMSFTVTSFAQGGTSGETTYTLGTVEVPNNSSTTPWTITWTQNWVGLKVGGGLGAFDYDGSVSGTGDAIQIFASVENNGEQSDINRSVTFTITGGDTHTITQSGPAGDAQP